MSDRLKQIRDRWCGLRGYPLSLEDQMTVLRDVRWMAVELHKSISDLEGRDRSLNSIRMKRRAKI